jgi:hypothetical protein
VIEAFFPAAALGLLHLLDIAIAVIKNDGRRAAFIAFERQDAVIREPAVMSPANRDPH